MRSLLQIRVEATRWRIKPAELAEASGLGYHTVYGALDEGGNPTAQTLEAMDAGIDRVIAAREAAAKAVEAGAATPTGTEA